MQRSGVPPRILALVVDLHTDAWASVKHGGRRSELFLLQRGLKQGSVFAPLLFNIFLGAILNACEDEFALGGGGLSASKLGVEFKWRANARLHVPCPDLMPAQSDFHVKRFFYIAYADDLVLMARSGPALQHMMNVFGEVAEAFGQQVSVTKTKVMVSERLEGEGAARSKPAISIHGELLEVVDSFIYLGSSVSWDGSMRGEIKRRVQRMCAAFSRWKGVLQNYDICVRARLLIFQSVVVSNGIYGCEVWNATNADFERLEGFHFHLLRLMLGPQVATASRTQMLEFVQQVAPKVVVLPMEAFAMKRMLRFWGHVARMDPWHNLQSLGARAIPNTLTYDVACRGGQGTLCFAMARAVEEFGLPLRGWESWAQDRLAWKALLDDRAKSFTRARWWWLQKQQQEKRREKVHRKYGDAEGLAAHIRQLSPDARHFGVMLKYFEEGILDIDGDEDAEDALDLESFISTDDSVDEFSYLEEVASNVDDPLRLSRSAQSIRRLHVLSGGRLSESYIDENADGRNAVGGVQTMVVVPANGSHPPPGCVANEACVDDMLNPDPFHHYYRNGKTVFMPRNRFHPPGNMVGILSRTRKAVQHAAVVVAAEQAAAAPLAPPSDAEMAVADRFLEEVGASWVALPSFGLVESPVQPKVPKEPIAKTLRYPKPIPLVKQRRVEIPCAVPPLGITQQCPLPTAPGFVVTCHSGQKRGFLTAEHIVSYPNAAMTKSVRHKLLHSRRRGGPAETSFESGGKGRDGRDSGGGDSVEGYLSGGDSEWGCSSGEGGDWREGSVNSDRTGEEEEEETNLEVRGSGGGTSRLKDVGEVWESWDGHEWGVSSAARGGGGGSDYDDDGWEVDVPAERRVGGGGGGVVESEVGGFRQQGGSHGEGWQDAANYQGAEDEVFGKGWQDEFDDDWVVEVLGTRGRRSEGGSVWRTINMDLVAQCPAGDEDVGGREVDMHVGKGDDSVWEECDERNVVCKRTRGWSAWRNKASRRNAVIAGQLKRLAMADALVVGGADGRKESSVGGGMSCGQGGDHVRFTRGGASSAQSTEVCGDVERGGDGFDARVWAQM